MRSIQESDAVERLIVALDVASQREAMELVERLDGTCRWFKVGMELYYAAGRGVVEDLVRRGYRVFLDLKLHDIPATVAGAVRSVAGTGASLLTIHAGGGASMMEAAAQAGSQSDGPRLLAVTVLTSIDSAELATLGVSESPREQVLRLARLARSAGVPDIVCSAAEVQGLRVEFGPQTLLVTPGIRPKGDEAADQRRVATPGMSLATGASMLVVGRPITRALDPAAAASAILDEMSVVLASLPPLR